MRQSKVAAAGWPRFGLWSRSRWAEGRGLGARLNRRDLVWGPEDPSHVEILRRGYSSTESLGKGGVLAGGWRCLVACSNA